MPQFVRMILMLEDEPERVVRFKAILSMNQRETGLFVHRTAAAFIDAHSRLPTAPRLIALDHDLFAEREGGPDPGDGRDVDRYLANCVPTCPVLIHSSNAPAAHAMLFTLQEAGWQVERIAPLGDDWIEGYWYPTAMRMMSTIRP